jgi:hypothetical protein
MRLGTLGVPGIFGFLRRPELQSLGARESVVTILWINAYAFCVLNQQADGNLLLLNVLY